MRNSLRGFHQPRESGSNRLIALAFIIIVVLLVATSVRSATISVDSVDLPSLTTERFSVAVRLSANTTDISGLTIPLVFDGDWLRVDSVSFVGSIKPGNIDGTVRLDNDNDSIYIGYVPHFANPLPRVSASSGLLATIHFSQAGSIQPGLFPIDSVNHVPTLERSTSLVISDPDGVAHMPNFEPGVVVVRTALDIEEPTDGTLPSDFTLDQNYPNPFNPTTTIEFTLPRQSQVRLEVFNVLGQQVDVLIDQSLSAGSHRIVFEADQKPSGVYFYRLSHEGGSETRKMLLLK